MTKHKHADLIHAWADGAEIQCKTAFGEWKDEWHPYWMVDYEYRIKPEEKKPVVRWLWAYRPYPDDQTVWVKWDIFMTDEEAGHTIKQTTKVKLEWSRTEFPE